MVLDSMEADIKSDFPSPFRSTVWREIIPFSPILSE
jgi:hypothetical protein